MIAFQRYQTLLINLWPHHLIFILTATCSHTDQRGGSSWNFQKIPALNTWNIYEDPACLPNLPIQMLSGHVSYLLSCTTLFPQPTCWKAKTQLSQAEFFRRFGGGGVKWWFYSPRSPWWPLSNCHACCLVSGLLAFTGSKTARPKVATPPATRTRKAANRMVTGMMGVKP